jgi:hypothetical protein
MAPGHGHDTRHVASFHIADASLSHGSQVPVTTVAFIPGPPASRYPVSIASIDADVPPPALSFCGTPIEMSPDGFSIESHSGGSVASTSSALVMQTMINGIQDMFRRQTITAREYHLARIASEDEARAARLRFEADIKSLISTSPKEPEPVHSLDQDVAPALMPHGHAPSPLTLHVGQYYPAPLRDTATVASRPQSRLFPYVTMSPVPKAIAMNLPY